MNTQVLNAAMSRATHGMWVARVRGLRAIAAALSRAGLAAAGALAMLIGGAWGLGQPEMYPVLQAATWAVGFAWLGFAMDARPGLSAWLAATGTAHLVLAVGSSVLAPELLMLAIVLDAAWLAVGICRP